MAQPFIPASSASIPSVTFNVAHFATPRPPPSPLKSVFIECSVFVHALLHCIVGAPGTEATHEGNAMPAIEFDGNSVIDTHPLGFETKLTLVARHSRLEQPTS